MAEWFKAHAWKVCVRVKAYRGFESLFLRQISTCSTNEPSMVSAGTFAVLDCEPRQGRKAATVVIDASAEVLPAGTTQVARFLVISNKNPALCKVLIALF
jgi:hypothetical protein